MDLTNKTIVITGAAGGMGQAIARALAADKAQLAISDADPNRLHQLESELKSQSPNLLAHPADVTDESSMQTFIAAARERFGSLDVLLNLAGLSIPGQIAEMAVEDFDRTLDVNLKGTFLGSKHFLAAVDPQRGGLIVNIASVAAKTANPNAPVYCTAKAAVSMFSQGLALQAKAKNVRVTTLLPGATDTAFWGDRPVPREKFLQPDDVVAAIRFVLALPPHVVVHELLFESFAFFKGK
jgi:NAD(P)-dependent dehydrogenase (short-subunit alcohol dehydrogenase family)